MKPIWIVAKKEFRDAWHDKIIVVLLSCLVLLVVVSIAVSAQHVGVEAAQYQTAVEQIKASGQVSKLVPPSFAPLRLLQNSVEYFEIIGAVLAIILGYSSIYSERASQTLQLVLTRRISRVQLIAGKLLGSGLILVALAAGFALFSVIAIWLVAGLTLSGIEVIKLCITAVLSVAYLLIFYSLSALLTLWFRTPASALVISLAIWVVFVLVLPQVGDTMDIDNQVPGGFFASLNLPKGSEKKVLTHFTTYEQIRNGTEESSPTKHYERAAFAFLGVKQEYDGKPLAAIWQAKWQNVTVLGVVAILACSLLLYGAHRNTMIWRL